GAEDDQQNQDNCRGNEGYEELPDCPGKGSSPGLRASRVDIATGGCLPLGVGRLARRTGNRAVVLRASGPEPQYGPRLAVVLPANRGPGEHGVGDVDLLRSLFGGAPGFRVADAVRMNVAHQLPVGAGDLALAGVNRDVENRIVV